VLFRSISLKTPCNKHINIEGDDLWCLAVNKVSSYFDYAIHKYLSNAEKGAKLPFPETKTLIPITNLLENGERSNINDIRAFSWNYFCCFKNIYALKLIRSMPMYMDGFYALDRGVHWTLEYLTHNALMAKPGYSKQFSDTLYMSIMKYLTRTYSDPPVWGKETGPGPFSLINTKELVKIAKREESVKRLYGESKLADIFERQLSLIAQSLGLYVIKGRKGRSSIDLFCISNNLTKNFTFLLEAKTSKNKYNLPAKDGRALVEYVAEAREILRNLPELSFILIVGPTPAKTIEKKICEVESKILLPVRYCEVEHIAKLRERIPGSLPSKPFKEIVLSAPHIIDKDCIDAIISSYYKEQESYTIFINSLYDSYTPVKIKM
jgi:hypothetical protein